MRKSIVGHQKFIVLSVLIATQILCTRCGSQQNEDDDGEKYVTHMVAEHKGSLLKHMFSDMDLQKHSSQLELKALETSDIAPMGDQRSDRRSRTGKSHTGEAADQQKIVSYQDEQVTASPNFENEQKTYGNEYPYGEYGAGRLTTSGEN